LHDDRYPIKKIKWGATKHKRCQYDLLVEAIAHMNDSRRVVFMFLSDTLAARG